MTIWTTAADTARERVDARSAATSLLADPRRAVLHLATFVVVATTLIATAAVDIASGSAPFMSLALWGALATLDVLAVLAMRAVSGTVDAHPPVPANGGVVMTGSIASTVKLDYDLGTAEKSYQPTRFVRALYRLSFQAPFPYADNAAALEAARHRRTVAGLLTKFWFGENMVARALDVRREDGGRYTFVTELIRGTEPKDAQRAKATLRELTARFLEAGLPSWQVGSYNPKAIPNLLEQHDGSYRIIDLESNLVTPVMPPAALIRAIRLGQYPSFDDLDVPRLRGYLAAHHDQIVRSLGEEESAQLFSTAEAYATAQGEWFAGERRIASKMLRFAFLLVDVPTWLRGLRRVTGRMSGGSQEMADRFIHAGIEDWSAEGHLSDGEATELQDALATPEVASVTANLGAHMAMSIPLRFPLGSLARFGWTVVARAKAEWAALRGRKPVSTARQIHTVPVALMGLVPGFGAGAYLLAKPLRAHRALAVIVFDRLLRKVPARLYWRLHVSALMTWFARPAAKSARSIRLAAALPAARERLAGMKPQWRLVAAVLALNAVTLAAAAVLHHGYDASFALSEFGLVNSLDAVQLLAAGVLGILAFRLFWRAAAGRASAAESAGIFLWGATGVGLIGFAFDDFFGLHEAAGAWITTHVGLMPLLTNNVDDFITLGYGVAGLALLAVFRHELFAVRASSALLVAGVVAAGMMLGTDAYGHGILKAFEFPSQVAAVGLLLLAHLVRYREVRAALPRQAAEPAAAPPPAPELSALALAGDE
jgi:hypothetical protein